MDGGKLGRGRCLHGCMARSIGLHTMGRGEHADLSPFVYTAAAAIMAVATAAVVTGLEL